LSLIILSIGWIASILSKPRVLIFHQLIVQFI